MVRGENSDNPLDSPLFSPQLTPQPGSSQVRYLAIGNEDCHHPYYAGNYLAIRAAVKQAFPAVRFIANCDLSKKGALPALAVRARWVTLRARWMTLRAR